MQTWPHKMTCSFLPAPGTRCQACGSEAWARPTYAQDIGSERYYKLRGIWVICTVCIPPRVWVRFFLKFDPFIEAIGLPRDMSRQMERDQAAICAQSPIDLADTSGLVIDPDGVVHKRKAAKHAEKDTGSQPQRRASSRVRQGRDRAVIQPSADAQPGIPSLPWA